MAGPVQAIIPEWHIQNFAGIVELVSALTSHSDK